MTSMPLKPRSMSIVALQDVWFRYGPEPPTLRGVNLTIPSGQWLAIIGCNGSGKSTLVKQFNGLLRPWRGTVRVKGQDIAHKQVGELARTVGYVPQNPDRLIFSPTVRDEVAFGPRQLGLSGNTLADRVDEALRLLDLERAAETPPALLGYGIRRKVALASVLALHPQLLILDEPTNGLDVGCARHVMDSVESLHREGTSVVMVSHDLDLVARYAQQVVVLQDGFLVAQGESRSIVSDMELLAQAGLMPLPVTQLASWLATTDAPSLPIHLLTPQEFVEAFLATYRLGGVMQEDVP